MLLCACKLSARGDAPSKSTLRVMATTFRQSGLLRSIVPDLIRKDHVRAAPAKILSTDHSNFPSFARVSPIAVSDISAPSSGHCADFHSSTEGSIAAVRRMPIRPHRHIARLTRRDEHPRLATHTEPGEGHNSIARPANLRIL